MSEDLKKQELAEKISKIMTAIQNLQDEFEARIISIEFQIDSLLEDIEKQ